MKPEEFYKPEVFSFFATSSPGTSEAMSYSRPEILFAYLQIQL